MALRKKSKSASDMDGTRPKLVLGCLGLLLSTEDMDAASSNECFLDDWFEASSSPVCVCEMLKNSF